MTPTTHDEQAGPRMLMAMELNRRGWNRDSMTGVGQATRRRTLRADSWRQVADEIVAAKRDSG